MPPSSDTVDAVSSNSPDKHSPEPQPALFERIAEDIYVQGYSIAPMGLPIELARSLLHYVHNKPEDDFSAAGIGRDQHHQRNERIRTDAIDWINGDSEPGRQWLAWSEELKQYLNRRLFLGLFSFESHFALYKPGDFYKRHVDAFKGQANRIVTIVVYLNEQWHESDGGALQLYLSEADEQGIAVLPELGTVVVFLSEDFPHEVKPALRERYSIAGWYRVNGSGVDRIDPPR